MGPPGPGKRSRRRVEVVLLLGAIVFPLVSRDTFLVDRVGRYFLLAVFAISVDLIWGYGGLFTFGHAAFFGGGGYLVGMLTTRDAGMLPLPLWPAVIAAVAGVALFALGMSYFVFSGRRALRGVEFAVVTLAVALAAERLTNAGGSVTGGQNGILMSESLRIRSSRTRTRGS
jgi:ABC-type branched-subunit amino acid transport system permease subunit